MTRVDVVTNAVIVSFILMAMFVVISFVASSSLEIFGSCFGPQVEMRLELISLIFATLGAISGLVSVILSLIFDI